ncbi:MAG: dihydroxyacetone kinase phosphoryl donor subunit DhaM [Halobaculum sp.]
MIGLLVVSHSADAARGVVEIAREMGGADAAITAVGGDPDGGIGTTVTAIRDGIEELLNRADGVVVLVDLGSAVMNAEHAVEELGVGDEVVIADAPLLEGAINAVTRAAGGATLQDVCQAAEDARQLSKT